MRAGDRATVWNATAALRRARSIGATKRGMVCSMVVVACLALGACATKPLMPHSADTPPLILAPASQAGVQDKRARFREIYCAVLEANGRALPDYRPCDEALARVGIEPAGTRTSGGVSAECGMRGFVAHAPSARPATTTIARAMPPLAAPIARARRDATVACDSMAKSLAGIVALLACGSLWSLQVRHPVEKLDVG